MPDCSLVRYVDLNGLQTSDSINELVGDGTYVYLSQYAASGGTPISKFLESDILDAHTWSLSGTATPSENIYGLYAGLDDADDLFDTVVNLTANAFVTNLAEATTQAWGLNISMPDSLSGYNMQQMTGTITLIASEAA